MEFNKTQTREMSITTVQPDDTRTVMLSFSSESPVTRIINGQEYNEILLHGQGNCDLTRLNNSAALLFNHNLDHQIGVVEIASIDQDKVGRALVRFSCTEKADEKYRMVMEKVLTKVSVGYEILDFRIEGQDLLVTSWMPYEISMVSVPADDLVGVGRSIDVSDEELYAEILNRPELLEMLQGQTDEPQEEAQAESESESTDTEQEPEQEQDSTESESTETEQEAGSEPDSEMINKTEEQERIAELEGMARVLKVDVTEAITKGISVADFKRQLTNINNNIKEDNKMEFSLKQLIRSFVDGTEIQSEMGERGAIVPASALRAVSSTTGASLIQETIKYDSYVDVLRANSILAKFNLMVISGLEGNGTLSIPYLGGDFTDSFGFVNEDSAGVEADPSFGSIDLVPRDFTGSVYLTHIMQKSASAAERFVSDAILKGSANKLEKLVMAEVVAEAGSNTDVTAVDYDTVIDGLATLGTNNVSEANIVAVMSPAMAALCRKVVVKGNTNAKFLLEGTGDNMVLAGSTPVVVSTLVADGVVVMGDFSNIVIASWGDLELDSDTTTARAKKGMYVRTWSTIDFKVTRPEAFHTITITA
ncbi:phage major capsid protein [Mangrovibacter plantisponsor]|uniref:HK97 family phage prohead protease n=1 Tax=Mangrovibacter plantisponsor TaxID=451513 RepID=A0A317PWX5_9ENTR|nr:phage major capsid protein [Mangrovibacter plantisponsor]PWW04977.1 HK97 family phage prohead protease [Mangrovibacter plantisponsor]